MTNPTATPIPSSAPNDLLFNAEKIDEAVNSAQPYYLDRFGVARKTLAGAMATISAVNPRGAWASATLYAPRDVVSNGGTWYVALDGHTSGATFAGDEEAHWRVFQGVPANDLADDTSSGSGAGMVGYSRSQSYVANTIGRWLNDLALAGGSDLIGWERDGTGAALRSVSDKLHETLSVRDFGALGDGSDDTAALLALVAYVNAIPNLDRFPIPIRFPAGFYVYGTTLAFTRPVVLYGEHGATLRYTGTSYAVKLGPDGLSGSDIQLNAEYTVEGLRFQDCTTCTHVIYINELVTEPRIRNCTFVDCGNGTSYCVYGQYGNWDAVIENCRLLVLNGSGGQGFIAFPGLARSPTGSAPYAVDPTGRTGHDGGNSRVTIRDCWMTSLAGQNLGVFALLSGVKSRVVGGGYQHSKYGVYLTGFASAVTLDSVYCELSTSASECFVYAESTNTSTYGRFQPEQVTARECYVNMHGGLGVTSPLVKTVDASMLFKGWRVDATLTDISNGTALIVQNDTAGQVGNAIDVRVPTDDISSAGKQYLIRGTYSNAERWQTRGGMALDKVGDATYTFTQSDVGRAKTKTGTTARNWTVPSDTTALIEVGSLIQAFHGGTAAPLSLVADTGVTLILTGTTTTGTRTVAPNGLATLRKLAPNTWWVDGPGVT